MKKGREKRESKKIRKSFNDTLKIWFIAWLALLGVRGEVNKKGSKLNYFRQGSVIMSEISERCANMEGINVCYATPAISSGVTWELLLLSFFSIHIIDMVSLLSF